MNINTNIILSHFKINISLSSLEHGLIFFILSFGLALLTSFIRPKDHYLFRLIALESTLGLIAIIDSYREWGMSSYPDPYSDAALRLVGIVVGVAIFAFFAGESRLFIPKKTASVRSWPIAITSLIVLSVLLMGLSFLSSPFQKASSSENEMLDVHEINKIAKQNDHLLDSLGKSGAAVNPSPNGKADNKQGADTPQSSGNSGADSSSSHSNSNAPANKSNNRTETGSGSTSDNQESGSPGSSSADSSSSRSAESRPIFAQSANWTSSEIIKAYEPRFNALENQANTKLLKLALNAKHDLANSNQAQLLGLYSKYKKQAEALDVSTNKQFNQLYTVLQNDLTHHGYDPNLAKPIKEKYIKDRLQTKKKAVKQALKAFTEAYPALSNLFK